MKSSTDPSTFYLVALKSFSLSICSKLAQHHPPCVPTCRKVSRELSFKDVLQDEFPRKQKLWCVLVCRRFLREYS